MRAWLEHHYLKDRTAKEYQRRFDLKPDYMKSQDTKERQLKMISKHMQHRNTEEERLALRKHYLMNMHNQFYVDDALVKVETRLGHYADLREKEMAKNRLHQVAFKAHRSSLPSIDRNNRIEANISIGLQERPKKIWK